MRVRQTAEYRAAIKRLVEKRKKRRERKEELALQYMKDYDFTLSEVDVPSFTEFVKTGKNYNEQLKEIETEVVGTKKESNK